VCVGCGGLGVGGGGGGGGGVGGGCGGGGAKSTMVIWNSDACILRPVKCRVFTSFAIFTLHNRFEDISVLLFANIKLSNHKKFLCRKNIGNGGICPTLNPPPPKLRLCS